MRFGRMMIDGEPRFVRLANGSAEPLAAPPWAGGLDRGPDGAARPFREAELLCPVAPSKIVCIGRNYVAHAKELGNPLPTEPLLFFKPPSSLLDPRGAVVLPADSERIEHEAELGVVIGRRARNVPAADAMSHVFGYTCVGDITARDLQKKDGQWTRAKGFDTFCPVGPWIESELDPKALRIECRVNGQTRQDGSTSDMVFNVATLIAYISRVMTLEPGDLIATGTPEGVGPLARGDALDIAVAGVGVLSVTVT
jgi:2-keto-4-pentenoate hydratase/2-oxohepta-3-ene-1,7-dioic acid hydratase in catechol pathway